MDNNLGIEGTNPTIPAATSYADDLPPTAEPDGRPLDLPASPAPSSATGVANVTLNAADDALGAALQARGGADRVTP